MNFGVVFAFMLSLPLARMEVSFRRGQRAVLPSCQPRAGREPPAAPARRCGGRCPGSGAEPGGTEPGAAEPGAAEPGVRWGARGSRARGRGPGPVPREGLRRGPAALMAGSDRRPPPAGEGTPLELARLRSGQPSEAVTPWSVHPSGAGSPVGTGPPRAARLAIHHPRVWSLLQGQGRPG